MASLKVGLNILDLDEVKALVRKVEATTTALRSEPLPTPTVARTCATCHHFEPLVRPERGWCHVFNRKQMSDDGCIKGWTALTPPPTGADQP